MCRTGDLSTLSNRKLSHSDPLLLASSSVAALLPGPPHSSTHTNLWEHQVSTLHQQCHALLTLNLLCPGAGPG